MKIFMLIAAFFVSVTVATTVVVRLNHHVQQPTLHTVSWFLANPSNLQATYSKCQDDPGDYGKTPDCMNADEADAQQADTNAWHYTPPAHVNIPNPFPNAANGEQNGSVPK